MLAQTFSSGQRLLDYLEKKGSQETSCVILDVQMPDMTGLEVLQRLRASSSDLPVIVITAHDTAHTREATLAAGVVAFLRKPFDDDVFASALAAAIGCRAAVPRDQS